METLPRIALALVIGRAGGAVFYQLNLPLRWRLGALFVTMAASIANAPILGPVRMRPAVGAVIGVLLGSHFTPDFVAGVSSWIGTVSVQMVYIVGVA